MSPLHELAARYVRALEAFDVEALRELVHPQMAQVELPNRLNPKGQTSDAADLLARMQKSTAVLSAQRYTIHHAIEQGDHLALEVGWAGTLRVPLGTLAPGDEMRASFAVFLEVRDGKVIRQRNYDCFEPF
jgi:ketosteroid isomerase-like protein